MKEKTRNILVGLIAALLPLLALGQEEVSEPATPFASKVVVPEVPYSITSVRLRFGGTTDCSRGHVFPHDLCSHSGHSLSECLAHRPRWKGRRAAPAVA